jgi:UDP:flavonoid glycosyltransferase YjiC (YdhE family)
VRPFHGHFHPLVPLAQALQRAGHRVAVATADELGGTVLAAGLAWIPAGLHPTAAGTIFEDDPHVDYGYQIVSGKVAELVDTLLSDFRADLVVREPTDLAPALAAEVIGVPCVDFGIANFIPVDRWRILGADETVAAIRRDYGLAPDPDLECLYRGLYLAVVPPEMEDVDPLPVPDVLPVRYETWDAAEADVRPAAWLDELPDRPTILLTLGTVFNNRTDVFAAALEALGTEDLNVVCTLGADQDPGALGAVPANVRLERYLPHSAVLSRCELMVCHMGFNTMMGALCAGVPLVSVALGSDQLHNARRAEDLGLAVHVPEEELTAVSIRDAVRTVLADRSYAGRTAAFAAALLFFLGGATATPSWWAIGQNDPASSEPSRVGATSARPTRPQPAADDPGRDLR